MKVILKALGIAVGLALETAILLLLGNVIGGLAISVRLAFAIAIYSALVLRAIEVRTANRVLNQ